MIFIKKNVKNYNESIDDDDDDGDIVILNESDDSIPKKSFSEKETAVPTKNKNMNK